jgi:hypothetical protein
VLILFMVCYQTIIAKCFGLVPMPVMDQTCFVSSRVAHINYMSITGFEGDYDEAWFRKLYEEKYLGTYEKFSYCVESVFGDYYYRVMPKEEAFNKGWHFESDPKKTLKNQYELDCFIRDNMNIKVVTDGPLWRAYGQIYFDPVEKKSYLI